MRSGRLKKIVLIIKILLLVSFLILVSVDVLNPGEEYKIGGIVIVGRDNMGTMASVKLVVEDTL